MIVLKLLRWIKGYVDFAGQGNFPERFINISTKLNVQMWNVKGGDKVISGSMNLKDYMNIRNVAKKSSVRLQVTKRYGLPFIINRNKKRAGLLIGAVCFLAILKIFSMFIWSVEINGNNKLSEALIKEVMAQNGVDIGGYKGRLDIPQIERTATVALSNVSWISINIVGTTAFVEIKESEVNPEIIDTKTPCNLKAKCDAKIIRIDVSKGVAETVSGDYVVKGQLLVNAVAEDAFGNSYLNHAQAKVYAETHQKISFDINNNATVSIPYEIASERKKLKVLGAELPITFSAISSKNTFKQCSTEEVTILGNKVPLWVNTEKWYTYAQIPIYMNDELIERASKKKILFLELFALNDKKILTKTVSKNKIDSGYEFDVNYTCEEDIAVEESISVEN